MAEKKPEEYLKQLNMPKLCARCGIQPGESTWPIYSRYDYSFQLVRTTYKKSRFFVPVCNACKFHLERDNALWLRMSWVSGIGMGVFVILAIVFFEYSIPFFILSLLAATGFIFAYFKRSKYWRDSSIASGTDHPRYRSSICCERHDTFRAGALPRSSLRICRHDRTHYGEYDYGDLPTARR